MGSATSGAGGAAGAAGLGRGLAAGAAGSGGGAVAGGAESASATGGSGSAVSIEGAVSASAAAGASVAGGSVRGSGTDGASAAGGGGAEAAASGSNGTPSRSAALRLASRMCAWPADESSATGLTTRWNHPSHLRQDADDRRYDGSQERRQGTTAGTRVAINKLWGSDYQQSATAERLNNLRASGPGIGADCSTAAGCRAGSHRAGKCRLIGGAGSRIRFPKRAGVSASVRFRRSSRRPCPVPVGPPLQEPWRQSRDCPA